MYNMPLVSIIMPSYNQYIYLEEGIISVLKQDYPNVELIIIDGGSDDGSLDILNEYSKYISYWISEPDKGPEDAVNKGLAISKGELIGILPCDDLLVHDAVSRKVSLFIAEPDIEFIYGDVEQIDEHGNRLFMRNGNDLPYIEWIRRCTMPIALQSVLMKRSVLSQIGEFKEKDSVVSDWRFLLYVVINCKIKYLEGIAGKFRTHPSCHSTVLKNSWSYKVPQMYEEFFARNDLPQEIKAIQNESLANAYIFSAYGLKEFASPQETVGRIAQAVGLYPQIIFSRSFAKLLLLCVMGSTVRRSFRKIREGLKVSDEYHS
jgi:glycosyltransferase involved in cell wall biosynthesis